MPRRRIPKAKAVVSGAALVNPQRFKGRGAPKGARPLGEPDPKMTPPQCAAWEELRAELPSLTASHRAILRLACIVQARIDADPTPGVGLLRAYSSILSKLGATPIDESRVAAADADGEDDDGRFFN